MMTSDVSDGELISRYQMSRDQTAARALVDRYHNIVLTRLGRVMSFADAEDVAQRFWVGFFTRTINKYEDTGRFEKYLSSALKRSKQEHWRNTGRRESTVLLAEDVFTHEGYETPESGSASVEQQMIGDELIGHLVNRLIPSLPAEQRLAWLLVNESDFFDPERRLTLNTLAQLNGISVEVAWQRFESTRDVLLANHHGPSKIIIDPEAFLIFMVFTHSQRPQRDQSYTMDYFANLLDLPLDTFKSRYYAAQRTLDSEIEAHRNGGRDER